MDTAEEESLRESVRRLVRTAAEITWHGVPLEVGCSFGGCRISRPDVAYEELYAEADRALYQAKSIGKSQFCLSRLV